MTSNRWLIVVSAILACLCLGSAAVLGAGYFYLQDEPPNPLSDSGYYIGRTKVYYHPGFGLDSPFAIPDADVASFKILDNAYAHDATRVYLNGQPIPAADPATFEILSYPYARDAHHIYSGIAIFSADVAHFEIIDQNIVRDSAHIYWAGAPISNDPVHLVLIGNFDFYTYFKDAETVFVNGNPIRGADPATFQVIATGYAQDAAHVFYFDQAIPAADSTTFTIIETPYARDAQSVFWLGTPISNADPQTFRVLNANFECAADAANAYYQDQVIPGVDASTIPLEAKANNCTATDLFLAP